MNRRFQHVMWNFALTVWLSMMSTEWILAAETSAGPEKLTGTWIITVSRINPPPGLPASFLGIATITPDGAVFGESNTTALRSLDYGNWVRTGPSSLMQKLRK